MAPPPLLVAAEILLLLAPDEPEHLFRAALVCKPWLRIICDLGFRRRYRDIHGIPPLLGFLHRLMAFQGSMPEVTASIRSAGVPPLEDDNLLAEILLRLPPQPSSLPRASVVCYRWLSVVSSASFFRRFRLHHSRNPPLLGFIDTTMDLHMDLHMYRTRLSFVPALEAPNRVPRGRFSLQFRGCDFVKTLSCRHGLVLISLPKRHEVLVWDPVTGEQNLVAVPPEFDMEKTLISGAVLRCTGVVPHFQVVLLGNQEKQDAVPVVGVYSSKTGVWSNVISTPLPQGWDSLVKPEVQPHRRCLSSLFASSPALFTGMRSALIGNSLYWLLPIGILEFDLDRQSLAMVPVRGEMCVKSYAHVSLMQAEGGGLGLLTLSDNARAQLWKRETDCDGLTSWVLGRTIQLDKLLHLNVEGNVQYLWVVGYVEYNNVVLLSTHTDHLMVQLKSLEVKKLSKDETSGIYHFRPFESVYPAGNSMSSHFRY